VYSVKYDSGSAPEYGIFSPRETLVLEPRLEKSRDLQSVSRSEAGPTNWWRGQRLRTRAACAQNRVSHLHRSQSCIAPPPLALRIVYRTSTDFPIRQSEG